MGDILAHFGVITRAPLGVTRIDGVSWTLEVEIYFYLVMAILGTRLLELDFKRYAGLSVVIFVLSALFFRVHGNLNGAQVACGLLLLLGVSYYSNLNGGVSKKQLLIMQFISSILISALWLGFANRTDRTFQWFGAYLLAIALFYGCFTFRAWFGVGRLTLHLASISYPLYVVHSMLGYVIIYALLKNGFGVYFSIGVATVAAYIVALCVHLWIENPSLRWIAFHRKHNNP